MGVEEQGYQACRELIFYHLTEYVKRKDLKGGRRIFSAFIHDGLESVSVLGDHLIRLFAVCGCLVDANHVFHSVHRPTIFTWKSIIVAHVSNGDGQGALFLFRKMQDHGFRPDKVTFLSALKACGSMHSASSGRVIHDQIIMFSLDADLSMGHSLINMYSKCGSLLEAYAVFVRLFTFNVVSWTVIIAAFAQCSSHFMFAFCLYDQMRQEGIQPNNFTFIASLQACISSGIVKHGKILHDHLIRSGCIVDKNLGSTIINMYSKCRYLQESRKVFYDLPNRDVVSWGAVISGHAQHGDSVIAIKLYKSMQEAGVKPDKFIYSSILKACAIEKATKLGSLIHNEIMENKFHVHVVVGTTLVDMHIEFGNLETAQRVFDELPQANEVSWGKMIKAHTQHGDAFSALLLFERMQKEGVQPSKAIYMYVLKACIGVRFYAQGKLIHDRLLRSKLEKDTFIASSIIEFYAQFGQFLEALLIFGKSENRDTMTWSVLLDGYLEHGLTDSALQLFEDMKGEKVKLDTFTCLCVLKACTSLHDLKLVHEHMIKHNFDEDGSICITLIGAYSKYGNIEEASWVFHNLQSKDVASWTALMQGLVDSGRCSYAFRVFEEMQDSGVQLSEVTYLCLLKACVSAKDVRKGILVHDEMMRSGLDFEVTIANALIDMYGSCGYVYEAWDVFDGLNYQDEVSWGTMMAAYSRHGHDILALELFGKMQQKGVKETVPILLCISKACGKLGAIVWGRLIHYLVVIDGFESDWAVISTLIYMYAECGYMIEVLLVFHTLPNQDLATWSILIAQCGDMDIARQLLVAMRQQGVHPNAQLFTNIISACAREGLLEEGEGYFKIMREGHGIAPNLWHCTSMANLLSRTGCTKEAYDLLQVVPMPPDQAIWRALLSGCKLHEDVILGECSFDQVINEIDGRFVVQDQGREAALSSKLESSRVKAKEQVDWEMDSRGELKEEHLAT